MMKRVISLSLCLIVLLSALVGCAKKDPDDKGAYVTMYLTDPVYNFDPARAYENEAVLKIVSLMFEPLFTLDDNGKIKKALAKSYKIDKEENSMIIMLNETAWSDGTLVSANDAVYAWKRLLDPSASFEAASLLYDIKGAREAKEGEVSIDDVQVSAWNQSEIQIYFNEGVDYDRFLLNLTSYALAPLRENIVNQTLNEYDWAKSPATFYASGAFKLRSLSYDKEDAGLVLERNSYYFRDKEKDAQDKYVRPYQIIVDYTKNAADLMAAYQAGKIFYVGDIPMSVRGSWVTEDNTTDALSTHTYVLNQNAVAQYYKPSAFQQLSLSTTQVDLSLEEGVDGDKIFEIPEVREALSLAIDREAIANAVVLARAATALVPYGIFETDSKKELFREVGEDILAPTASLNEAKSLLSSAGIDPTKYMFAISVADYDTVHKEIAKKVAAAWNELGFHVAVKSIKNIENPKEHIDKTTQEPILGIMDDTFAETYAQNLYEVAAIDLVAYSADAASVLARFAKHFTGSAAATRSDFIIPTHRTGYDSEDYNEKMEEVFAATDAEARAALLHEAESILMEDLPVIPIVFNQNATLVSEELSKYDFTYYGTPVIKKMKLKDYQLYVPKKDEEE